LEREIEIERDREIDRGGGLEKRKRGETRLERRRLVELVS